MADRRGDLDRRPHGINTESATGKDLLIAAHMKIGETVGELDFVAIDRDGAKRPLPSAAGRKIICIDRKEPTDVGATADEEARRTLLVAQMHDIDRWRSKDVY